MRVASLNLWHRYGPWERRQQRIVDNLRIINPDVLLLQEVWEGQAPYIARLLGYQYFHYAAYEKCNIDDDTELCGNAILSKYLITNVKEIVLPHSPDDCDDIFTDDTSEYYDSNDSSTATTDDEYCCAIICNIDDITVCCTHLSWRLDAIKVRTDQIQKILSNLDFSQKIIFGGDFNMIPYMPEYNTIIEHFTDCGASDGRPTWDNKNIYTRQKNEEDKRLDYIFIKNIGAFLYHLFNEDPAKPMSDHWCVVTDIMA